MTAVQLLKEAERLGVCFEVRNNRLVCRAPAGVVDEKLKQALKKHKQEILALLRDLPEINYEYCKSRDCSYLLDHIANPRCLHPLCTKNGRRTGGLWLYMLKGCPADTNRLTWSVPDVPPLAVKSFKIKTSTEVKKIIKGTLVEIEDPKRARALISRGLVKPVDGTSLKLQRKIKTWGCLSCPWVLEDELVCVVDVADVTPMIPICYLKDCPRRNPDIKEAIRRGNSLKWLDRH